MTELESLSSPIRAGGVDPENRSPAFADRMISGGKADRVSMGRALIADPERTNKAVADRIRDIRTCTHCQHCSRRVAEGKSIECTVNPEIG